MIILLLLITRLYLVWSSGWGELGGRDWVLCFLNRRSWVLSCTLISTFSACFHLIQELMKPVELNVNHPVDFNGQQTDPRSVLSRLPYVLTNAVPPPLSRLCLTQLPYLLTSWCMLFSLLVKQGLLSFSALHKVNAYLDRACTCRHH